MTLPSLVRQCTTTFKSTTYYQTRTYTLSRFPSRHPGAGRSRPKLSKQPQKPEPGTPHGDSTSTADSPFWRASQHQIPDNPSGGLHKLLGTRTLIIERQIEMLNVFVGFEQTNKYSISNAVGEQVGYIAEEPRGLIGVVARQVFATHRPFRAVILDSTGTPLLWLRRPFSWINSRMYVQRFADEENTSAHEPVLDTFAEVQQIWHPWRRRYDLFLQESSNRILTPINEPRPESSPVRFRQFARVDAGFLAWNFAIEDGRGEEMAFISRAFRGFGREIFTDTGQYAVHFCPRTHLDESNVPQTASIDLTLEERAVFLALAVNIDFDYFSHHSGHGGFMHMSHWD